MKRIEKFVAEDGSEYTSESLALRRDELIVLVSGIMGTLTPRPDSCDFGNGRLGYIQQKARTVNAAIESILDLCRDDLKGSFQKWLDAADKEGAFKYRNSMLCRLIGECCASPLSSAWGRFCCMDGAYREWGQPYFVTHCADNQTEYKPELSSGKESVTS